MASVSNQQLTFRGRHVDLGPGPGSPLCRALSDRAEGRAHGSADAVGGGGEAGARAAQESRGPRCRWKRGRSRLRDQSARQAH